MQSQNRYMCLFNNTIYEFSNPGSCNKEFNLSKDLKGCYYNMLAYENNYKKLDYFLIYVGENKHIKILYYSFIFSSEDNYLNKSLEINNKIIENPNALSCQLFIIDDYQLICFYIIKPNLYAEIFDINNNLTSNNTVKTSCNCENVDNHIISIVSSKSQYDNKILVFWEQKNNTLYYIIYNRTSFFENDIRTLGECDTNNQLMDTYFYLDNFIFLCLLKSNNNKYKYFEMPETKEEFAYNITEELIDNDGYLVIDRLYWFYNKSYDICNFNTYTCPLNYSNIEIIDTSMDSTSITDNIQTNSENVVLLNITNLLKNKEPGQIYKIEEKDYTIVIKPINSAMEPDSTYINFQECENILRNHYNISNSSFITLLQLELYNNNSKSLINKVEYEVYDNNYTKLNLNLCKDVNIQIYYAIKEDMLINIDVETINSLKNKGVDVFNINDSFFWDVCQPYSSDIGNDLILEDRIKDLYQNYSLCEEGCTYNDLSMENMTVLCDCKIKENITTVVSEINLDKIKYETTSNFDIIKCYDIIFKFKLKITNIGFWIFTILLILHFPLIFYYFYTGVEPVYNFVINQMIIYGYMEKNNNKENGNNDTKRKKEIFRKNKSKKKKHNKNNPPPRKNINKNKIITNVFILGKDMKKKSMNNDVQKSSKRKIKKNKKNIILNNSNNDNSRNLMTNKRKKINLTNMQTQNPDEEKKEDKKNIIDFPLITINLNKKNQKDYFPQQSTRILNNYTFEEAMKYDQRSLCEIYFIYLLSKQIIFHVFFFKSPFQLFSLRLCLLFFIFSCDLALNALFYFNNIISKKYHNVENLFLFTFNNNITVVILSTFVGLILLTLFTKLSNSTNALREIFRNEEEKMKKNNKYKVNDERKKEIKEEIEKIFKNYKIKIIVFISIELLFMIFFWYYVTIFCHVYPSTQISWIFDSFLSILSRIIIDNIICLGLAKLYRIGVDSNINCIYKFAMFLYEF